MLDVEATEAIYEIKLKLQAREGTPFELQRLFRSGSNTALEDDSTLADCGVQHESKLLLLGRSQEKTRGPPHEAMECPCGHVLPGTAKFCAKCGRPREAGKVITVFKAMDRRATLPASLEADGRPNFLDTSTAPKVCESWTIAVDRSDGTKLGMSINKKQLRIDRIIPDGLVATWNAKNPERAIEVGFKILEVNGKTSGNDILAECVKSQPLTIKVSNASTDNEVLKRGRDSLPVGDAEIAKLRHQYELCPTNQTMEATELHSFTLGPFEAGTACEFVDAWYGWQHKRIEVTQQLRDLYSTEAGLKLGMHTYNKTFGVDPAPLKVKTLTVTYRLHNVRQWDVSRATYAEGVSGKFYMMPTLMAKAVTNVVGLTLAASGFAVGKMEVGMKNTWDHVVHGEKEDGTMADSAAFQWGFMSWLNLNGIFPNITYRDTNNAGKRLRSMYCPSEDPPVVPPPEDMKQTPIIVANHTCYLDGMILAAVFGAPKVLAKAGTIAMPIIGRFADEIGVIEVDRADKDSRTKSVEAITSHVRDWRPGLRPLLLFPEGTTSNGDDLLDFKKGAFLPGQPLRPVILCYTGNWHPANVNFKTGTNGEIEPTSDAEWYSQFLGHMVHSLQIKVLPPYIPNEEEKHNPELFMNNVRVVMSKEFLELKDECERKRAQIAQEGWQGMAQRTLIDKPMDMASNASNRLSEFFQGAVGTILGESRNLSPPPQERRRTEAFDRSASVPSEKTRSSRARTRSEERRKPRKLPGEEAT